MGRDSFDIGKDILTPEIIKNMTGLDVVLIDTSKSGWQKVLKDELSQAVDVNGNPIARGRENFDELFRAVTTTWAATWGVAMQKQVIIYNKDLMSFAGSPWGWAQSALRFVQPEPEYVNGVAIFEHPALLANMSILTEVSHGLWKKRDAENTSSTDMGTKIWLENPDNRKRPEFLAGIEAGQDESVAALNAILKIQYITDSVLMEIRGDADSANWVKKWAQDHDRPDILHASEDFSALRVTHPLMSASHMMGISLIKEHTPQDKLDPRLLKAEKVFAKDVRETEDMVAGVASILHNQGAVPTSEKDFRLIESTLNDAAKILTVVQAQNHDFKSRELFIADPDKMQDTILEVFRTGKLPELPKEYAHLIPDSEPAKQRLIDVMIMAGIAIERHTPNFNGINSPKDTLSTSVNLDTWGLQDPGKHWNFESFVPKPAPVPHLGAQP